MFTDDCLVDLNIQTPKFESNEKNPTAVSLLSDHVIDEFLASKPQPAGVVPWSPPLPNWNPWTGCNIDEGPLATQSLDEYSEQLLAENRRKQLNDASFQASVKERQVLPVMNMRGPLMEAINENSVIIVRGNTGCGKTTQVCQFILDDYIASGQGAWCNIVVTQPRRISAVSVSERVAAERCENLGDAIG